MTTLAERYAAVQQRIVRAAEGAGRDPASVNLVAVSKRHPAQAMRELYALGQRRFGENYAQELCAKAEQLADLPELELHFIGGFQRNKARDLARASRVVETLASPSHVQALARRATRPLDVFLQVNVGGEAQKSGCTVEALPELIQEAGAHETLRLLGLMTIPPAGDPELARRCYRELRALAEAHELSGLSMGMSADLEVAVEEGATHVRVGTAIFGPRPT